VTVQDGAIWIGNADRSVEVHPTLIKARAK
jgi:hypothetical protein